MEKTINVRQLSLIAFVATFSLKLTALAAMLHQAVNVDGVIVMLGIALLDFISFLFIYYVLKRNQDISFYEFLSRSIGKILAKIFMGAIAVFFFFKFLLLNSGGYGYAREVIFQEAPLILFVFILLTCASSLYLFRSKSYGRTVEFIYPLIAVMFVGFIIVSFITAEFYDIRPLFQSGAANIGKNIFGYIVAGGDYIFMLLFMGKIKFGNKKSDNRTIYGHIIFALVLLIAFYFLFYSIFKYTAFLHPNAISEIVQFLPLPTILGNFDWLAITLMMLLFLLQGGLFMFCVCDPLCDVIRYKNFNKKKWKVFIMFFVNALILICLYLLFRNLSDIKIFAVTYIKYIAAFLHLLPVIAFFIDIIKKRSLKKRRITDEKIL